MKTSMKIIMSGCVASLALMQAPSIARDSQNFVPSATLKFKVPKSGNVLGDPIKRAIYKKPDADRANHALTSDEATHALTSDTATTAGRANLAVYIEEKAPFGQALSFSQTQSTAGVRKRARVFNRPNGSNTVLIEANCHGVGDGNISRTLISFDFPSSFAATSNFDRRLTLCDAKDVSGSIDRRNTVNLDVPAGATAVTVTQVTGRTYEDTTAKTAGSVQWFGPHSLSEDVVATAGRYQLISNNIAQWQQLPQQPQSSGSSSNDCFSDRLTYEGCVGKVYATWK